jgi:hypothetical protein
MGLFGKRFSKQPACSGATGDDQAAARSVPLPSEEAIEQMSLAELNHLIDVENRTLPTTVTVGFLGAIYRRAMEIAYHSHGTSNEDRAHAAIIARATREGMLGARQNEDLSPLRTAIEATENRAKTTGYGTLHWLLEEHQVSSEQTIQFIMQPKYGHLLGGMLDTLKPDVRAGMRDGLVAELFRTRRVRDGDSVVFIAHGLAVANEPATVALFSRVELSALRNAHRDYTKARTVLSDLGLLPARSSARGFEPEPSGPLVAECVGLELHAQWWHAKEDEPALADFLSGSKDPWRTAFLITSWLLCCHLALVTVEAAYGAEARKALAIALPEGLDKFNIQKIPEFSWAEGIQYADDFSNLEKALEEQSQHIDAALLYHQLKLILGEPLEIAETERDAVSAWFDQAVHLLTRTRVRFLGRIRFSLRMLSEGYRLLGFNSSLGAIDIMNKGMEKKDRALWEDFVLSPPFD